MRSYKIKSLKQLISLTKWINVAKVKGYSYMLRPKNIDQIREGRKAMNENKYLVKNIVIKYMHES